jgi:hypothetical protein
MHRNIASQIQEAEIQAASVIYYSRHPCLHLKGNWLGEAGFETGCPVKVHIAPGRIMICPG